MNAFKCDLCGKLFDRSNVFTDKENRKSLMEIKYIHCIKPSTPGYGGGFLCQSSYTDFCKDCQKSFEKWVEEREKEREKK